MRRYLVVAPAAAALFFFLRTFTGDLPDQIAVRDIVAGFVATGFCIHIAFRFGPGEALRTAWLANGLSFLAVTLLAFQPWVEPATNPLVYLVARTSIATAANVLSIASILAFTRAYQLVGLELPGTRWQRVVVVAAGVVCAALLGGAPLVDAVRRLISLDATAIVDTVSAAGDLIIAMLLVPMLLAALALRGGLLVWPWSFIVASNGMYLCYDAQISLYPTDWVDFWMIASASLAVAAVLAQRDVLAANLEPA